MKAAPKLRLTLRRTALLPLACLLALGACAGGERLYTVPDAPEAALARQAVRYGTIEVLDVSLPDYAAAQEIATRQPDGSLLSDRALLWADLPGRAVTLELTRYLGRITGAQVASEPWPFVDRAQARVEVRVADMLAEGDGSFRLSGQYFVAPEMGGRGRSGLFDIRVPLAGNGPGAVAAARGQAVAQLAAQIAGEGLR